MKIKFLFSIIMFGISINSLYGQPKEEVYVILYPAKFPGNCPLSFLIIDNDSIKFARYNIHFSLRRKNKITGIQKRQTGIYDSVHFERLENGNVFIEYAIKDNKKYLRGAEYNSTDNFKIPDNYDFPKGYLIELFSLDNYDLLKYLDENFTKYSGPDEYKNVPLLKKR